METTGLSRQSINKHYDSWLAEQQAQSSELAEMTSLRSMARLEHMYNRIAEYAYGQLDEGIFDKYSFEVLLKTQKEQRDWVALRDKTAAKSDGQTVNVNNMTVTMTANNPLYESARHNIVSQHDADWTSFSELDINDLYVIDGEAMHKSLEEVDEQLSTRTANPGDDGG